jgi:hypothetical protein
VTRILLDPTELAGAASDLRGAAGEYQGIGARVVLCDCGCMPPDVAATVDAAAASIRSRLDGLGAAFVEESSELAWRAGVPQDGVVVGGAASAAWGGAADNGQSVVVGGGFDTGVFSSGAAGSGVVVGGGFDTSVFGSGSGGGYNLVIGGNDFSTTGTGGGYNLVIGGNDFSTTGTGGGYSLVIGGNGFSIPDDGLTIGSGFNLTDWGLGGTGYGDRTLGSFTPTTMGESMAVLTGMAARNNDWFTMSMLQNIQGSMNRAAGIWTLPEGWGYRYSPGWY